MSAAPVGRLAVAAGGAMTEEALGGPIGDYGQFLAWVYAAAVDFEEVDRVLAFTDGLLRERGEARAAACELADRLAGSYLGSAQAGYLRGLRRRFPWLRWEEGG